MTTSQYRLVNARTGQPLAQRLEVARATWRRVVALLGRRWLEPGEGNRFLANGSEDSGISRIYRLPVDILFLDREGTVLHAVHSLPPFVGRQNGAGGVHSVVELPPGTLARFDTRTGDVIEMYQLRDLRDSRGRSA